MKDKLIAQATKNIGDIINLSIKLQPSENALVIYDTQNGLTDILTQAYRNVLPGATFLDFDKLTKEEVIAACDQMKSNDLVVLIQTSNFRLDEFRIRIHLFQNKLKVIEHTHLYRDTEDVWDVYIDSLAYDPDWYHGVGLKLKSKLEDAKKLEIQSGDSQLVVTGGLLMPKLNIGDYTGMENVGGTFPIGEVFTEAKDSKMMNGSIMIYAYAGTNFEINMHTPFRIDIKDGLVVDWADDAPQTFIDIVKTVSSYERPIIREIGFGLNRAITRERYVQDITAFERILGMHLSLGEKHTVYKKADIATSKTKFHVDLFPVADRVQADGEVIFENGKYLV